MRKSGKIYATLCAFIFSILSVECAVLSKESTVENSMFSCYKSAGQVKVEVDGIPYLAGDLWGEIEEGRQIDLGGLGIRAKYLYILGGCNSHDIPHPAWGGGRADKNFFIGNPLGETVLTYAGGRRDIVPLIYGYSAFTSQGYKNAPEPFKSDPHIRNMLDDALCVAHAVNGFETDKSQYYIRIALRNEVLESVGFVDSTEKVGLVEIRGLSFDGVAGCSAPAKFQKLSAAGLPSGQAEWLMEHTISSKSPFPDSRVLAIKKLQEKFYTSPAQITSELIAKTTPRVEAKDFSGPKVTFSGSPIAELMTRIYYDNTADLVERIDDDGMVHESAKGSDYYNSFAGYAPGLGAFYTSAYTRYRGLTILSNIGLDGNVNAAVDFFDRWMMYFPQSYPDLQLGGKPVPGHATVVANKPHLYFDELKNLGWPTKYTTRDFGNPETDGHGMLMITRWRVWLKQGREPKWVLDRWDAINEAAEFIPWALDNPELSFSEHGLLYNETEGGRYAPSMYCDFVCYLGLLGYADMAAAVGKPEKASRWRGQAQRLFDAMMAYYPLEKEPWGTVWDPAKNGMFHYTHSTLAPVCIGMDYWGYDVMNRLPDGWLEITQNTYKMQLENNEPEFAAEFAATAGIGYGQGYITQSALLLDEMDDAGKMVDWMAKICFAPNLKYPYTVPEGSIIDHDSKRWRRWGDLGNGYQLNEVIYTIQLMVGIDDVDPAQLKIMPRIPANWDGMEIEGWPVRTISGGQSKIVKISVKSQRANEATLDLDISFERPIDHARLRVGPFDSRFNQLEILGREESLELFTSGDSKWAWVELDAKKRTHSLKCTAVRNL